MIDNIPERELRTDIDVDAVLDAVRSGIHSTDPRVVALRKAFVDDEVQVATWTVHEPRRPIRSHRQNLIKPTGEHNE